MRYLVLIGLLLLVACRSGENSSFCALNSPRYYTDKEIQQMKDERIVEALVHNELGERLCGWRPPK